MDLKKTGSIVRDVPLIRYDFVFSPDESGMTSFLVQMNWIIVQEKCEETSNILSLLQHHWWMQEVTRYEPPVQFLSFQNLAK